MTRSSHSSSNCGWVSASGHSGDRNSRLPQWMSCHSRARRLAKKPLACWVACWLISCSWRRATGISRLRHGGQAREQFFGAFQPEAIDRHLKVFRRLGHAAMGVPVGFANHAQGQGRAVLHQFGDVAQRAAVVADGLADAVMTGLRNRQAHAIEKLDPAFESGRFWSWNVRFVSHGLDAIIVCTVQLCPERAKLAFRLNWL